MATEDWLHDGNPRRGLCLNVNALWSELDAHFAQFSERLERDCELRRRATQNATRRKRSEPPRDALLAWRAFLAAQIGVRP